MSYIYALEAVWNDADTDYVGIGMNFTNGAGGSPVASEDSLLFALYDDGDVVFSVDIDGNIPYAPPFGSNSATRTQASKNAEVVSVKDFGAVGDGPNTDDTIAVQNALDYIKSVSGRLLFPRGVYMCAGGLELLTTEDVDIEGEGWSNTWICTGPTADVRLFHISGGRCCLRNIGLMGSGAQLNYSPTIAPNDISDTSYALHIGDQGTFQLDKCLVFGGSNCVLVEGFDLLSNDSWVAFGYGTSNWLQRGNGLWVHRLNLDHQYPVGSTSTDSDPWQAGHVYSANDLAVVDGFNLQCLTGGTSAGTAPTILPYLQEIDDGSVTWLLASRVDSSSYEQNSGGSECYLNLVDITSCTENAIRFVDDFSSVPSYINMSQSIIGGTIGPAMSIRAGHSVFMSNCLCGPIEFIDDWAGNAYISHNNIGGGNTAIYLGSTAVNHDFSHNRFSSPVGAGSTAIEIDAATTALVIESNILGNYATGISLVTGCNQYVIANNDASSITSDPLVDNANGNIKTIQGNLGIDDILGNKVTYSASTTDRASLQIPTGAAPTSPIDGEIWREDNTDTGLKIRINGMTKTIVVA